MIRWRPSKCIKQQLLTAKISTRLFCGGWGGDGSGARGRGSGRGGDGRFNRGGAFNAACTISIVI